MEKLLAVQTELKAPKSKMNAHMKFKYRNCEDILEAVKPLLKKHDLLLTISDDIVEVGGRDYVKATATVSEPDGIKCHSVSAFARESATARKGMDDAQCSGSCSSYARKYALGGLFLIDGEKDADTMNSPEEEYISPLEAMGLKESIKITGADTEKFLKYMGVSSIDIIPKGEYQKGFIALESKKEKK